MNEPQIQMINQDVLANFPVEELERRLELQIMRPSGALCCSWDSTCSDCCECTCYDIVGYCPDLCTSYCPTLCSSYCPGESPCSSYLQTK